MISPVEEIVEANARLLYFVTWLNQVRADTNQKRRLIFIRVLMRSVDVANSCNEIGYRKDDGE